MKRVFIACMLALCFNSIANAKAGFDPYQVMADICNGKGMLSIATETTESAFASAPEITINAEAIFALHTQTYGDEGVNDTSYNRQYLAIRCEIPVNATKFIVALSSADGTYNKVLKEYTTIPENRIINDSIRLQVPEDGLYHFHFSCSFDGNEEAIAWEGTPEYSITEKPDEMPAYLERALEQEKNIKNTRQPSRKAHPTTNNNINKVKKEQPTQQKTEAATPQAKSDNAAGTQPTAEDTKENKAAENTKEAETTTEPAAQASDTTLITDTESISETRETGVENGESTDFCPYLYLAILIIVAIILWMLVRKSIAAAESKDKKITEFQKQLSIARKETFEASEKVSKLIPHTAATVQAPAEKPALNIEECDKNLAAFATELAGICAQHREIIQQMQELIDESTSNLSKRKKLVDTKNEFAAFTDKNISQDLIEKFCLVHPNFKSNIESIIPQASESDIIFCICLYLSVTTKDIAALIGKETRSIESMRNRLRKKIGLDGGENLQSFIARYC